MSLRATKAHRLALYFAAIAYVVITLVISVGATSISINIPEKDESWPWRPQLDLHVPDRFFTGDAEYLTNEDQWRVLAQVGAPLRITSDSSYDLMRLLELVNFMRADGQGQCPHYTTPYRTVYYRFHAEELEVLYGEARWAALQRLQEPKAWSLVMKESVGPAVREAEAFIARLKSVDPPGILVLNVADQTHDVSELRVPLADFRVHVRVILAGHPLEYRLPQLTLDGEAVGRRRQIHYFLQQKEKFSAQVARFDAATMQAQADLQDALAELRQEEQSAYDSHAHFKERYQRFLMERQSHSGAKVVEAGADDTFGNGGKAHMSKLRRGSPSLVRVPALTPQVCTADERRAVACQKVHAAWATLQRNGVRWEKDGRAVQLRRLHARHDCPEGLPSLVNVSEQRSKHSERADAHLKLAAQRSWRMAVAEMMAQRGKSGRPPTFAQLYAVVFAVWKAEREEAVQQDVVNGASSNNQGSAAHSASNNSTNAFLPVDFVRFVHVFVESGDAAAMAGGWLPRFVRAELHYLAGILQLVTPHTQNTSSVTRDVGPVVYGVLHLYESLGAGSHHAAGALATLREHGMFTRQHTKAAMVLLLRSMKAAPSHLLRELLLAPHKQPGNQNTLPASSVNGGFSPDALRLLRFEQFYAVDHTFREVDDPFMSRAGVRTMVAVTNENIHSTDDAPELEDVYREAEVERGGGESEGSITIRLQRRVLKASMLMSGFKDTPQDAREAQCELLVVLRQLGYFCDLNLRSVLSTERSRGARNSRVETIVGLPLPDSCPEHEAEVYRVLGNTRHTLLSCPQGNIAVSSPALAHPRVHAPTSKTLHTMLHMVLISLSYLHLLHTQQTELSHMYAALSVEASLRVQQLLVTRLGRLREAGHLFDSDTGDSFNASSSSSRSPLSPYEALWELAESSDEIAFAAEHLTDAIETATEDDEKRREKKKKGRRSSVSPDERATHAVGRCRSVADSPFVNTEALLLLALSRWARGGPLAAGSVQPSDVERRLSQWTMEPFRLLAGLLGSPATTLTPPDGHLRVDNDDELTMVKRTAQLRKQEAALHQRDGKIKSEPLDAHALFLVCLAAMKRWKSDFKLVHLLDSTSYSVRRTDPFVLASFLLHANNPATGAPLLSLPKVREVALAASPHFLGRVPHFLPLVDDTVEVYAARLLRFAARHIHSLEPTMELLRSGSYAVGNVMDRAAQPSRSAVARRRQDVMDDAPPRRFRLRTLRRVKQQTLETADLQPLLYAADAHEYLNASRWTYMGTALNAAYNALLYPFTFTTTESVLVAMEAHLQFIAPAELDTVMHAFLVRDGASNDVHDRAEKPRADSGATAMSGASREATTHDPSSSSSTSPADVATSEEATSVSPFVDAFAKDVALREHFIAGQLLSFALESGMPEGFSLVLYEATDRGNPFLRRLADVLADAVFGRWAASVWTEHHLSAQWQREKRDLPMDGSLLTLNTRSPFRYASVEARQELFARLSRWKAGRAVAAASVAEARSELLWCSGLLTRRAYYASAQVYPFGYEGAIFPAADLECVAELNALLRTQGAQTGTAVQWSKLQRRQAQTNGTRLLRDLGDRLAYVYDLVESAPPRRFPLSESAFRSNVSDLDAAAQLADRQHTQRERFSHASTQLVEPWNRRSRDISAETLGYGEGTYYNGRLHRVSGYRWGATVQSWWLWLRHLFP